HYSSTVNGVAVVGSVGFAVTPVHDAPLPTVGAGSGAEDTVIAVSLTGTDVDGTVSTVIIDRLPTFGTVLLADGVTPVVLGQTITAAPAANLWFRPDPNQFGNTSIGFTVLDNAGAASAPGDWTLSVAPVD